MRQLFTVAGFAAGLATANGNARVLQENTYQAVEYALRRNLQANMLCGTSGQSTAESIRPYCSRASDAMSVISWNACCAFDGEYQNEMCRTFTAEGQYCNTATDDCSLLDANDKLYFSVQFLANENEKCCKSCVCYGDPECVSFDGTKDLWIPCDGREENCRITKAKCSTLTDPNGGTCKWIRTNGNDNRDWSMPMNGSPCVPDLTKEIKMNMYRYNSGSKNFKLDLTLGERGVISSAIFTLDGSQYVLDAIKCFEEEGSDAWKGSKAPANAITTANNRQTQIAWSFFHQSTQTFVKLYCVRAVDETSTGIARLNIQEITVRDGQNGDGFCETGAIEGRTGTWEQSMALHEKCVQNKADAMQACKHLVNLALTYRELPECAANFCKVADLDTKSCTKYLGDGSNADRWMTKYCEAISNNGELPKGTSINACKKMVAAEGYTYATTTWGKGTPANKPGQTCSTSISAYAYKNKRSCEDGLTIDIYKNGEWVPSYFIPTYNPPCGGKLTVTAPEARDLFTNSVRVRQCDTRSMSECQGSGTCTTTSGAVFNLEYTNTQRQLFELYNSGILQCPPDSTGSVTWCLPSGDDYVVSNLCPCPDPNQRLLFGN